MTYYTNNKKFLNTPHVQLLYILQKFFIFKRLNNCFLYTILYSKLLQFANYISFNNDNFIR